MTTLAAAISIDSRGPCALYIASDSRITWGSAQYRWDSGQKTFISSTDPDIFGYCGSAFFPTQILNHVSRQMEAGVLFGSNANADERHGRWLRTVKASIANSSQAQIKGFSILHGSRDSSGMSSSFRLWQSKYTAEGQSWTDDEIKIRDNHSHFVSIEGTGEKPLTNRIMESCRSDFAQTSRLAFQTFFKSLQEHDDPKSGGAPQIVGIYRISNAQHFGTI